MTKIKREELIATLNMPSPDREIGNGLALRNVPLGTREGKAVMQRYGLSRQDLTDAANAYNPAFSHTTQKGSIEFLLRGRYNVRRPLLLAGYAEIAAPEAYFEDERDRQDED